MKSETTGYRADEGADLTPEEMEAAIALFKAQKATENVTGEGIDGEETEAPEAEEEAPTAPAADKSPVDRVRENVDRRDAEGSTMAPEDIIAEQKADLDTLLAEIDKMQASSDMGTEADSCEENADAEEVPAPKTEGEAKADKGVNMDSVDQRFMERLDICRMADKLNLDGVESLSITAGRKKIIKAVNPKINLDGKSDTYILAAYDIAKDTFKDRKSTDTQRMQMLDSQIRKDAKEECNSSTARKQMINRMTGGRK